MIVALPVAAHAQSDETNTPPPEAQQPAEEKAEAEPAADEAAEPKATETEQTEDAETQYFEESEVTVRGLSWDALAGGVPESGGILQAEFGFSNLPRVGYLITLFDNFALGGVAALDFARFAPDEAFKTNLVLLAAARYSFFNNGDWSAAVRAEPGVRIGFAGPVDFSFLLNLQGHFGYMVAPRLIVGGGIDIPIEIAAVNRGPAVFSIPLLFGAITEFHVTPQLALTADLKAGPHFNTANSARPVNIPATQFGLRFLVGIAVRL